MKSKFTLLFILLAGVFWAFDLVAQPPTPPIYYKADSVITCPGPGVHVFVPITVKNCHSVAAFDLFLNFDTTAITYVATTYQNPIFATSGFGAVNGLNNQWAATFFSLDTVDLANDTLYIIEFNYKQNWSALVWDTAQSSFTNGNLLTMPSLPINGLVGLTGPVIVSQPVNVTIPSNGNTQFHITGTNITSYQWQYSTDGTTWFDLTNTGFYSNVTTGTLLLSNVNPSIDGMWYRCKVNGPCGIQYSNPGKLLVVSTTPIVTSIGANTYCNGTITVPVMVTDFYNVRNFTLSINYNIPLTVPNVLTYSTMQNVNPDVQGTFTVTPSTGNLLINFQGNINHTSEFGNDTLFNLVFTTHPGTTAFNWDLSNCQYLTPAGSPHFVNFTNANLTVIPQPTLPGPITGSSPLCNDGSVYTYSTTVNANYTSYIWVLSPPDAGIVTPNNNTCHVSWDPTFSGNATLTVQGANSCGTSTPNGKFITVHMPSSVALNSLSNVCQHADPIALTGGTPTGGTYSGAGVYNGNFIADSTTLGNHIITYAYTNVNNCTSSDTAIIKVLPLPSVAFSVTPFNVCYTWAPFILDGGTPSGGTYSGPGVNSGSGIFTPGFGLIGNQNLKYTVTGTNGCTNAAYSMLHCDQCIGIDNQNTNLSFSVQPNPNNGLFEVNVNNLKDDASLAIYNDLGQQVYNENLKPSAGIKVKLDLSNQSRGMYFLILNCKGNIQTDKIILK